MKKTISVMLCVVFVLCCFSFSTNAQGDDWVFIWDNNIVFVDSENKPIIKDSKTYLPVDFILPYFNATYTYDSDVNTLNINMVNKDIYIDLTYGIVITSDGKNYYELIPQENGKMYISLSFLTGQAEYILTYLPNGIPHIKTISSALADTDLSRLTKLMPSDASKRGIAPTYYFVAFGTSNYSKFTQTARTHSIDITFFINEDDILNRAMSVCELAVSSKQFGICLSDSFLSKNPTNKQIVEQVEKTNMLLERLTRTKVNLVGLEYSSRFATEELSAALSNAGYSLWTPNMILPENDNVTASASTNVQLFDRISDYIRWNCCIQIKNTNAAITHLDKLLTYFGSNGLTVGSIYKGSRSVNFNNSVYDTYGSK